jgi:Protein of unknown function (DUF2738)
MSSNKQTTVLSTIENYDVSRMVFGQPIEVNSNGVKFMRVPITTRNPDGSQGDLLFSTPELFSFGVQEDKDKATGKTTGYSMSFCMWNRNGATDEEKQWIRKFEEICDHAKNHLVENRASIKKFDLEHRDLKRFANVLYYKRLEDGSIDTSKGPTLYPKLIVSKKSGTPKILTTFHNANTGAKMDPEEIMGQGIGQGKPCTVVGAIKFDGIFVGVTGISIQLKVWEAVVRVNDSGMKSFLTSSTTGDDTGSLDGSDEESRPLLLR